MTAAVSEDWDDLVETLRSDLETVAGGSPEDEEVRSAIDEVWTIVDAAEDRIGSVDAEEVGEVLGVETNGEGDAIDVESIPGEFVSEDPDRAAGLSRLVSLVNLDGATDYDVGRLWVDEGDENGEAGASEGGSSDEDDSVAPSTDEGDSDHSMGDVGEELRSHLGDTLSQFRERIQEAREGIDGSSEREDEATEDDDEGADSESSGPGSSRSSDRSTTAVSTIPSERHDMGGVPRFSTMPGKQGR